MVRLGYLPKDISKDSHGNYFYQIGESRSIFAAHLDTVSSKHQDVKHVLDGETIKTDGTTTLGADDKAGVTILIWMMKHNIPGTYYFFIGEESGCIGSGLAAKYGEFKGKYDRIISFDRRGTTSIITHQSWSRCCSDVFADALCDQLNKSDKLKYIKDDGGVYTDSAEFVDLIPECTNVSVGYYSEHTMRESQDIRHLVDLCQFDWIIIGGESGNETGKYRYRPCKIEWMEDIINAFPKNVKVFVKQMGTHLAKELRMSDRHGGNIDEFPPTLQIREFPKGSR